MFLQRISAIKEHNEASLFHDIYILAASWDPVGQETFLLSSDDRQIAE
jgi:hypothetical protein